VIERNSHVNNVSIHGAVVRNFSPAEAVREVQGLRVPFPESQSQTPYARIASVRRTIAARADRKRIFSASLFSDPAWDMLLELYVASLAQRRLQISRLMERTGVPGTTTLRWITALEREGLIQRESDRLDARLVLLSLTEEGRKAMDVYFDMLPADTAVL
jgi:DNA-binding MarR family transcriptional regulator